MNFDQNEEQQLLAESLKRYLARDYGFEPRKAIIRSAAGYSDAAWATFADMGLTAMPLAADYDGFGQGASELMPVMEAFGEALVVEPFASTVVGARLIERAGNPAQRQALLPQVAAGQMRLAFAHAEAGRRGPAGVGLAARQEGDAWVLDGEKTLALHAPLAHRIVVSARTAGAPGERAGLALFLVEPGAAGLSMDRYRTFDNQMAADLRFSGVRLAADGLLGEPRAAGGAFDAIDEALDFATALACAEAVGAIRFANDTTLEYLKTRKQFGVPIGSFQALQHRMVDMVIEWELARSMALLACAKVDAVQSGQPSDHDNASAAASGDAASASGTDVADPADERRRVVSAAKVRVSEAARKVAQESVQLHGGMGLTEEMKVSHTFRRLTALALSFGDVDEHLARFTGLRG